MKWYKRNIWERWKNTGAKSYIISKPFAGAYLIFSINLRLATSLIVIKSVTFDEPKSLTWYNKVNYDIYDVNIHNDEDKLANFLEDLRDHHLRIT